MAFANGLNSSMFGPARSNYSSGRPFQIGSNDLFKGSLSGAGNPRPDSPSGDAKSYLLALRQFGGGLGRATGGPHAGQSILSVLAGLSSNNDALSVGIANQADAAKSGGAKNVSIYSLAEAQRNIGTSANATALSGADTGANQFSIEKGGKSYSFLVQVNKYDSNRTVQQKTADAINKQKIGVAASVQYDENAKRSTLALSSAATGASNSFRISDTPGKGSLVQQLGAGQTAKAARDASYSVDGEQKASESNTVNLGDGLIGTLKKAGTDSAVSVMNGKDAGTIAAAVRDIIDGVNDLLRKTTGGGKDPGAEDLRRLLEEIAGLHTVSPSDAGTTSSKDDVLTGLLLNTGA